MRVVCFPYHPCTCSLIRTSQERAPDRSSTVLGICNTAGAERFDSLSSFYSRGARAAISCYDMSDNSLFADLSTRWIKKVIEQGDASCHIIFCGTKGTLSVTCLSVMGPSISVPC